MAVGFEPDRTPCAFPTSEMAKQEALARIRYALTPATGNPRDGYICPICGSGSGAKHTGLTEDEHRPGYFTCWASDCTSNGAKKSCSGLDLFARYMNFTGDSGEMYKQVMNYLGIRVSKNAPVPKGRPSNDRRAFEQAERAKKERKELENIDFTDYFTGCHARLLEEYNKLNSKAIAYLEKRGITRADVERYKLGYDPCHKPKNLKGLCNRTSERIIFPRCRNSYMDRAIEEGVIPEKQVQGDGNALWLADYDPTKPIQIVVEGEIDAITLMKLPSISSAASSASISVIGLGSISNVGICANLLFDAKEQRKGTPMLVLIAFDNDFYSEQVKNKNPGQEAQARMAVLLQEKGILALAADAYSLYGESTLYNENAGFPSIELDRSGAHSADLNAAYFVLGADELDKRVSAQIDRVNELYVRQIESGSPEVPADPVIAESFAAYNILTDGNLARQLKERNAAATSEQKIVTKKGIIEPKDVEKLANDVLADYDYTDPDDIYAYCADFINSINPDEGEQSTQEALITAANVLDTAQSLDFRTKVLNLCGNCPYYLAKKRGELNSEGFRGKCANCKRSTRLDIYKGDLVEAFIDERIDRLMEQQNHSENVKDIAKAAIERTTERVVRTPPQPKNGERKKKGSDVAKHNGKIIETLHAEGKGDREIAEMVGISHMSVYRYLKSHNLK